MELWGSCAQLNALTSRRDLSDRPRISHWARTDETHLSFSHCFHPMVENISFRTTLVHLRGQVDGTWRSDERERKTAPTRGHTSVEPYIDKVREFPPPGYTWTVFGSNPHSQHHLPALSPKLPQPVTPLKGHSSSPRSCPPTLPPPSERLGTDKTGSNIASPPSESLGTNNTGSII